MYSFSLLSMFTFTPNYYTIFVLKFEAVRMNIFKTFETFLKEPLSILRDNFIQIVSIQTGNIFEHKPSIDVTVLKDKAQLTVVNNEKVYKLLSLVTHRAKEREKEKTGS